MHRGVSSITSRLDNIKPNDDGETFTLTLSREDVDAFQELKAKLAELEPKTDESMKTSKSWIWRVISNGALYC